MDYCGWLADGVFLGILFFSLYMDIYGLISTWFCRSILYLHAFSCADRWSAFADWWSPLADCWSTYNESESPLPLEFENSNSKEKFGKWFFSVLTILWGLCIECILRYLHVSLCIFQTGVERYKKIHLDTTYLNVSFCIFASGSKRYIYSNLLALRIFQNNTFALRISQHAMQFDLEYSKINVCT